MRKFIENRYIQFIAFFVLIEGVAVVLQPSKFSIMIGLALILIFGGLFFVSYYQGSYSSSLPHLKEMDTTWFPYFGVVLILLEISAIYLLWDPHTNVIGRTDILIIIGSSAWILYNLVPEGFGRERDFVFVFMNMLVLFLVVPALSLNYLIYLDLTNEWNSNEIVVNFFLAKPLGSVLMLVGIDNMVNKDTISFFDVEGRLVRVWIAKHCTGLYSVAIFLAAFISFLITEIRVINRKTLSLLFLGIVVAYFANLLRMTIVILAGYYYGNEALYWTHTNIGWIIFMFWNFVFWGFVFRYLSWDSVRNDKLQT